MTNNSSADIYLKLPVELSAFQLILMFQHVYLVVFSLFVDRIPVPDLKLHKVSSALSQAAMFFQ